MCCTSPFGENNIYYLLHAIGALAIFHLTITFFEVVQNKVFGCITLDICEPM